MDKHIQKRLMEAMNKYDLDAIIAYSMENVAYCTGYVIPSQMLNMRARQFAVVMSRDGKATLILTANELSEAQERSRLREFRPYDEFSEDPMAIITATLTEIGVDKARIGIEMNVLPAGSWEALKIYLPSAQWEDGTKAFQHARLIKTPSELEKLRKAAQAAEIAQAKMHQHVKEGMTEHEIYKYLIGEIIGAGADKILMTQVAAGKRSTYSNPSPGEYAIKQGDVVKIDVFAIVGGYLSDTGRAFVVKKANQYQYDVWSRMQETQAALLDMIKPGIGTKDLWQKFVQTFDTYNMKPAIKFLGHGLGLSLHEEPFISANTDLELKEGMVFAIEPIYVNEDKTMGFHLEDNVIVTKKGVENMTNTFSPELLVLG